MPTFNTTTSGDTAKSEKTIDFATDVRPILSDKCFACHGPDAGQRATEFRLDQKESALSADLGLIVPGNPQASELVRRIFSSDPDEVMPPADHLKKLTDQQKQVLKEWIEQGALWAEHWSFVAPQNPTAPEVNQRQWPRNDIDQFVLSKLESNGIPTSPEATPKELLRRLCFDLTGLAPSADQLQKFEDEIKQQGMDRAYERAVDRLLASSHYGERMAVYWLDLVRYADSVGYHGDQPVSVSPYRDYVINAFNRNLPFDQFTKEQLAGDLLDSPTLEQKIASGYNRLGMMSAEGGVQPEEYLNKYAADRVRTTGSVWLGMTLGCCECHDHKFDPISSREFYEFSAFFADIKEKGLYAGGERSRDWGPYINVPDKDLEQLLDPVDAEIALLEERLLETPATSARRMIWEKSFQHAKSAWTVLAPTSFKSLGESVPDSLDDGSILLSGESPDVDCYVVLANVDPKSKAFRLEALPDESLPRRGPGRAGNGNFVITEFIVLAGDQSSRINDLKKPMGNWPDDLKRKVIELQNATATTEQKKGGENHPDKKWSAASTIDEDKNGKTWGWAVLPKVGQSHELVIQKADPHALPTDQVTVVIQQYHANGSHTLGRFRISSCIDGSAVADPFRSLPDDIQSILKTEPEDRKPEQSKTLQAYYTSRAPEFSEINRQLADLRKRRGKILEDHSRTTLITVSVPPRDIRVLPRGNWMDRSGPLVQPGVPSILGKLPNVRSEPPERPTRLDLANWLVSNSNPLTSRVFVNRIWRLFFGAGLSNVLDDFGAQGESPSHPALLDHLAVQFVESGWDVKGLIRTIVMSSTYRQSSAYRPDLREIDPENRFLARQSRFRVDAEFVRDHALASSGLLDRSLGGRSVFPYQPAGLYRHLNFPKRQYKASDGRDQYRRGLYTHWQRQYLHPAMKTFDAPAREECTAARPRSSTPLAALVLLNDPSYVEAARALAAKTIHQYRSTDERLQQIFKVTLTRDIRDQELEVLQQLLESHLEYFENNPDAATEFLAIGQFTDPNHAEPIELAAWTSVCRAVMNMHEFVLRK